MADAELSSLRSKLVAARAEAVAAAAALPALRQRAESTAASLAKVEQQAESLRTQLDQLRATDPLSPQIAVLEGQLATAEASVLRAHIAADRARFALQAGGRRDTAARTALADVEARYHARADALLTAIAPTLPILLLPVRLETRFDRRTSTETDLLVRIYADDIAEDAHRPALTAEEGTWAREFATQTAAGTSQAEAERAWIRLAQRFGPGRAAWIARQATSGSPADAPAAWTSASRARALPDSWLVRAYRGDPAEILRGQVPAEIVARSAPILAPLSTGPAPDTTPRRVLPDSGLEVDDAMRWMVDFEEAVRVGMGVRIGLTDDQAAAGFDLLMVFGVRVSLDETESASELTALLDAHHYTWGLGIVPQGTPTNNTDEGTAGYGSREADLAARFRTERGTALCAAGDGSDGASLTAALGIGTDALAHVAHANRGDQREAGYMLDALWPATWGYFVDEMLNPIFRDLSGLEFDLERWRAFAVRHVRARGPLPALRVGSQPYGVLPVTSLDRWQPVTPLPEIIYFHILNPAQDNVGQYQISWDARPGGNLGEFTKPISVPGWFGWENQGGAVAAFDLDGSGRVDLFVAHIDNPGGENAGYYRVGQDLKGHGPTGRGTAASWTDPIRIPGSFGAVSRAMGIAVTRVPGRARPALVVHHAEHPDVRIASGPEAVRLRRAGHLVVFGRGTDGILYQKRNDEDWGNWEPIDSAPTASDPAAVASIASIVDRREERVELRDDRVDLFCLREPDNAIWHRSFADGRWTEWVSLGGTFSSGPGACSWAPGRLDVFARGTDGSLHHAWMDREWSAWESLGGVITSDPAAVSWGPDRLDVFARGTDNALYHKWFETASGWSEWEWLGGVLTSGPAACSWAAGRLDVFVRGTDGTLYHKWFETRAGWSDWVGLGGAPASDPSAWSSGPGHIDVVVTDADGRLQYLAYVAGRWRGWETLADRERAYYRVGLDLDTAGNVTGGWTNPRALPGLFAGEIKGGGLAAADVNGNGTPDLVVFHLESAASGTKGVYRIGWNLDSTGGVSGWSAPLEVPLPLSNPLEGADVAVADLTGTGRPDLLVHYVESRLGERYPTLRIGYNLNLDGVPDAWSDVLTLNSLGHPVAGVGITVAHVGRSSSLYPYDATGFVNWLSVLREPWRRSLAKVPHVGTVAEDDSPNLRLVRMLGMEPLSTAFAVRSVLSLRFLEWHWEYFQLPVYGVWSTNHSALATSAAKALGLYGDVRLRDTGFTAQATELHGPLVQAGTASETENLGDRSYIRWLMTARPEAIQGHALPQGIARDSLLYLVLRQAVLLEYGRAACMFPPPAPGPKQRSIKLPDPMEPLDPSTVDITRFMALGTERTFTPWRQLLELVEPTRPQPTIAEALHSVAKTDPSHPLVVGITRMRKVLGYLARVPTAALERLLCETLDLSTHRLDAWITAVAAERLAWVRDATSRPAGEPVGKPTGIALGAYGWVEDLRPVQAAGPNGGYVHAPSLAHAATAAILRSGYLAHGGDTGDGALAVDLSSARVRLAVSLLEGVREGQPLSALLGYQFERGLHENHGALALDKYVRAFRDLAPVVARKLTPSTEPAESVAASNVVDGLALLRRWQRGKKDNTWDGTTIPFGGKTPSGAGSFPAITTVRTGTLTTAQKEYLALVRELDRLEEALDAVADTVVAESVYQVVQGSPMRAGATLDAVSRGEVPPPDPGVVRSPRTGIGLTHRLVTLFEGDVPTTDPFVVAWDPATAEQRALQVRAAAEPRLNAWAARLLGDPARVQCRVEYIDPTSGALTESQITLKDLALSPLDVVYAAAEVEATPRIGSGQGAVYFPARSEIEERIRLHAMATLSGGAPVRLIYDRDTSWTPADVSFPELLDVARRVRDLITSARALEGRDLGQPKDAKQAAVLDTATIRQRADAAVNALDDANKALDLLANESTPEPDALRDALLALAYFGVQGAMPQVSSGSSDDLRAALKAQAKRLVADVAPRVKWLREAEERLAGIPADSADASAAQQREREYAVGRLHAVFGNDFRVLPRFRPYGAADLTASLNDGAVLLRKQPLAPVSWLQRVARVRAGAARLETTLLCAEATGAGDSLRLQVAQLPRDRNEPNERWVGLGGPVKGGRLSIVAHVPGHSGSFDARQWLSGLLVDEWVEVVPSVEETTAVTFHYDAPAAVAPQSLLLAVPPDVRKHWRPDTIEAILLETLELAKLRLVDLDALGEVGHYVPGLYFAFNEAGDTFSADFSAVAGTPP